VELCARFGTHVDAADAARSLGLAPIEAAARLQQRGMNVLTPPKDDSEFVKFVGH
jgi:hypothetical protein